MFHKWRSIENYERIDKDLLSQVECDLFYVTEKLDGCNVCICNKREVIDELNWHESWVVRSRNGGDFSENADVKVAMKKIEPFLDFIRDTLRYDWNRDFREIVIYGELINSKLLHRIWYGDKTPQIRLFGLSYFYPTLERWIDSTIEGLFRYARWYESTTNIDTQQYFVPIIGEKNPFWGQSEQSAISTKSTLTNCQRKANCQLTGLSKVTFFITLIGRVVKLSR